MQRQLPLMPNGADGSLHARPSGPGSPDPQARDQRKRRRFSRLRKTLLLLIVAYALVMTFGGCADKLILYPSRQPIPSPGATRQTIPFHDGAIEIWSARTPAARMVEPRAFVLALCGNADRAESAVQFECEQWERHPVEIWAVNYPGYGGSDGPARLKSIAPASLAAYDALARQASGRPIYVTGLSLGTTAALHVSANRPVAGLVLHNPPPLRQLILGQYGWWNLWLAAAPIALQIPSELDSLHNAQRTTSPTVFILADQDEVVPPRYHDKVVAAHAGEHKVIHLPNADHNAAPAGPEEVQVRDGIDWLWNRASPDSTSTPATSAAR